MSPWQQQKVKKIIVMIIFVVSDSVLERLILWCEQNYNIA